MAALQFAKVEHGLFSTQRDSVEIYPGRRQWTAADGRSGTSPTDTPLDELSFIYFLRTLPLRNDSVQVFDRFYDAARDPVTVQVVGHEDVATGAGTFASVKVEMRVRDPRHYHGEGTILIDFSDDVRRIPVRIQSTAPGYGKTVLILESLSTASR
jgi:hypothetical protein